MRFIFKTKYDQDINVSRHKGDRFWYSLLIITMISMPLLIDEFYLGEISYICILAIAGIGLMILFTSIIFMYVDIRMIYTKSSNL